MRNHIATYIYEGSPDFSSRVHTQMKYAPEEVVEQCWTCYLVVPWWHPKNVLCSEASTRYVCLIGSERNAQNAQPSRKQLVNSIFPTSQVEMERGVPKARYCPPEHPRFFFAIVFG